MFITIDGGDGSGKGRQLELLKSWLKERGVDFAFFRDPGDTALGEAIRNLLLNRCELAVSSKAELALFMAARAQLVHEKICPALEMGKVVIVDRFLLSTAVYQGYAIGANENEIAQIWQMGAQITKGTLPEVTFILDCPSEIAFQRIDNRTKDRIESKGAEYHKRVAQGYRDAAKDWSRYSFGDVYLIDATLPPAEVFEKIKEALAPRLGL